MANEENGNPERKPFPIGEFYFYVIGLVVAAPLAKIAWDSLAIGDYVRGGIALAAAASAAAGAFSFRYWESHLAEPMRKALQQALSHKALVSAILLVFAGYCSLVVPDLWDKTHRAIDDREKISLRSQLDDAKRRISELARENEELRRLVPNAPPPTHDSFNSVYSMSENQVAALADALADLKPILPATIVITRMQNDNPSYGLSVQLGRAFDRANIEPQYNWSRPQKPRDSGIRIRVQDLSAPPEGSEKVAAALKKVLGVEAAFEQQNMDAKTFYIFVGPKPD